MEYFAFLRSSVVSQMISRRRVRLIHTYTCILAVGRGSSQAVRSFVGFRARPENSQNQEVNSSRKRYFCPTFCQGCVCINLEIRSHLASLSSGKLV